MTTILLSYVAKINFNGEGPMKRALGNWVTGNLFWDRKEELLMFLEYLRDGANILLTAPRRIGKTSLMREAEVRLGDEVICIQVDFQKAQCAADAMVDLTVAMHTHQPLLSKAAAVFSQFWSRIAGAIETIKVHELSIQLRAEISDENWREKGDRLLQVLAESDKHVVLFLDEVPILVNRILQGGDYVITEQRKRETDEFMSWLRENTIRHKGKLGIVLTGSIGLEPILRFAGLNATLNTFTAFSLGAWPHDVAKEFLHTIAAEYELSMSAEVANGIVSRLGYCIPHYLQVYFEYIYRTCRMTSVHVVTEELAAAVYDREMLGVRGHSEMSHLEERLKTVLGPERSPLAIELLTELAVTGQLTSESTRIIAERYAWEGKSLDAILVEILGILEHDLYIVLENDSYRPVSKFVSDWWRARF
jgi:hypothetical protein